MAQRGSGYGDLGGIFYTPEWPVGCLLSAYSLYGFEHVIEPCAGAGHICAALARAGARNIKASDIAPAPDRAVWRRTIKRLNVFDLDLPGSGSVAIITNPPYGHTNNDAVKLARRLVADLSGRRGRRMLALLCQRGIDAGKTRYDFFRDCDGYDGEVVLGDRIRWVNLEQKKAGPSMSHSWHVWQWPNQRPYPIKQYRDRAEGEAFLAGALTGKQSKRRGGPQGPSGKQSKRRGAAQAATGTPGERSHI